MTNPKLVRKRIQIGCTSKEDLHFPHLPIEKRKMGPMYLFCSFLVLLSSASSAIVDPRGARPVEHGYKASECATEKEWPVCIDYDWGTKCPSGCRIQGLLDQADQHLVAKIDKIRKILEENRKNYRSTDQVTKETYNFLRDRLVIDSGNDNKYMGLAEQLRQRIVSIKVKIETQLRLLQALKGRVRDQVTEMKRLEVDIDIKLRSCKGSCSSYTDYSVDRESYITLDKQISQLDAMSMQSIQTVTSLRVMKSASMKVFKTKSEYFADVDQQSLSLEGTGTGSSSTATISSDPGNQSHPWVVVVKSGAVEEDHPDVHARSLKSNTEAMQSDYVGKDCVDILQKHASGAKSGLFKIKPDGSQDVVEVYCDHDTMLAGWVLVQQRMDGSVNFNRTWKDYRNGFGSVDQWGRGELWLGNKYLHLLTQAESMLRVELEDWEGREFYAEYCVRIGPEAEGYAMNVSGYQGDAGDALVKGQPDLGAFLSHANMKFSTYDRDSDKWEENCAEMYGGGWWYNNCQSANLNGIYFKGGQYDPGSNIPYEIENGVVWLPLKPADYSLKTVRMKVRPLTTIVWKRNIQPLQRDRQGYFRGRGRWCPADTQPPLCTDDDWDLKCPSGCRVQGHIDTTEERLLDRFGQICDRVKEDRHKAEKTMMWTKQIYGANRKIIVKNYVAEAKYLELMDKLQKNLTSVKRHATELSTKLKAQYVRIQKQIAAIYRTEVDIDMKVRACQGSCKNAEVYNIDKESYRSLEKELHKFHQTSEQVKQPARDIGKLKMKPVSDDPPILRSFKKLPFSEQELLTHFEDIEQYELEVENMTHDLSVR
ncbi:hypothetical protein SKAU_G00034770 [Synaphobranchus kaupii]|uniref:Fibrinogen C-terminal domain-containing protein n=1 Tax=Synaphobranchus kaupii TaxID=118154 RepID=A0A9Q1GEJ3_SYNKA|nr:hypothetical protein SKAU_G00034770 [Synaphobranchus kaupii]